LTPNNCEGIEQVNPKINTTDETDIVLNKPHNSSDLHNEHLEDQNQSVQSTQEYIKESQKMTKNDSNLNENYDREIKEIKENENDVIIVKEINVV